VKRTCGMAFLLGTLFFFPFPNRLMAPGYGELPPLRVPTLREAVLELPPSWSAKIFSGVEQTRWTFFSATEYIRFLAICLRKFIVELIVYSDTPLSPFAR
jgi:hypothetical protein